MGFFDKIFSGLAKNTYKGICRAMINSYRKVKQQNPKVEKRELYALVLSLRPGWKRSNPASFTFKKGAQELTIDKDDVFENVVRGVIHLETKPPGLSMMRDPVSMTAYYNEVNEVVDEEFKDFRE